MASTSKRQQTFAKRSRELAVKAKRQQKLEKKYAAAAERTGKTEEPLTGPRLTDGPR
jgi:hypothetical protein